MEDKRLTGWTEERVATLKKMWSEGSTAAEIAKALGFQKRNPVCGKIDRLGLGRKGAKVARSERETAQRVEVKAKAQTDGSTRQDFAPGLTEASVGRLLRKRTAKPEIQTVPSAVMDAAGVIPRHLPLLELQDHECRWPYGEGPFTFCGCTKAVTGPYCFPHVARSRGQGTASERAVAPMTQEAA